MKPPSRIEFLQKIIPMIRSDTSSNAKLAGAQLAIDILKWGIEDAGSMSGIRRALLRQFAKADPEYDKPIPLEIDAPARSPVLSDTEKDDRETEKQVEGLRWAREELKKKGMSPKPSVSSAAEERKRQAFVQKAEDLAGSLQFEFCKSSVSYLEKKYDHDTAMTIAAALANYVFRFGYVSPQHASDSGLMATVADERPKVLDSFSSIFKTNSTGVLILLGAAWSVNLTEFKRHMRSLAEDGFAQIGRNTPNVQRELPSADAVYMYELTTLSSEVTHKG
jgi:hypothetical protein